VRLVDSPALSSDLATQVLALAADAEAVDGHPPLSEQVLLHLADPGTHLVALTEDGAAVGYAHRGSGSAELVVAPGARRTGIGSALLQAVTEPGLQVWAHGDSEAARALAEQAGFTRSRVLLQMRLPLERAPLPDVRLPDGVRIRSFVVGQDEHAWTALNALAFAHHPEQGTWGVDEVLARERTTWFDPAGFLLAERDSGLVGFHWTKEHGPELGEVYVVGVHPAEQGSGLGSALTLAGLHHLRARGMQTVLLYVDEDNAAAVRVYTRLGFAVHATDVQWVAPS
jgi:mycothiol synthase